ncbi:MAG: NAD(P)/FAD-dependent oxidoreductase [Thermoanaerobaculia bacterium]
MASSAFDVVVAGGGPAGLALALTLVRHTRLTVLVIERGAYLDPRVGETLSPGVQGLLEYLGVWQGFGEAGHLPAFGTTAAWGSAAPATRDFLLSPFGSGWHLDRRRFDADLALAAESQGAVPWRGAQLLSVEPRGSGWRLAVSRPGGVETLEARFLVDATGKGAALSRRLGGDRRVLDRQVAITATLRFARQEPAETLTLVEACEVGWWYSARLPGRERVVALITDADLAQAEGLASPERWQGALAAMPSTARRLAGGHLLGRPRVVAAHSACLTQVVGEGWLAVGDAAACHDPLSSSGIARALDGGIAAARALHASLALGRAEALAEYQRRESQAFDQYCATRARYYQLEQRWPEAPYWRRRQRLITLDPRGELAANPWPPRSRAAGRLPADLRHLEASLLAEICGPGRPAHEVVAEHRGRARQPASDVEVILALQWLLTTGLLQERAPRAKAG